jgi:hypothetical protein
MANITNLIGCFVFIKLATNLWKLLENENPHSSPSGKHGKVNKNKLFW